MKLYDKGFSLVQVMIGLGLTGIVSLGVMTQLNKFKSDSLRIERKVELDLFLDNIARTLSKRKICYANFKDFDVTQVGPNILYGNENKTQILIEKGKSYLSNSISINDIFVNYDATKTSEFELTIVAQKNKEKNANNTIARKISIAANMNGTIVDSCYLNLDELETTENIVCEGLGVVKDDESCFHRNLEAATDFTCPEGFSLESIKYEMAPGNYKYVGECVENFILDSCTTGRVKSSINGTFECLNEDDLIDNTPVTVEAGGEMKLEFDSGKLALTFEPGNITVNGVCNSSTRNACLTGTANDGALADTSKDYRWKCEGENGGVNATCSKSKPADGKCDNSKQNRCSSGKANDSAIADSADRYKWRCDGVGGGKNSGTCSIVKACYFYAGKSQCFIGFGDLDTSGHGDCDTESCIGNTYSSCRASGGENCCAWGSPTARVDCHALKGAECLSPKNASYCTLKKSKY